MINQTSPDNRQSNGNFPLRQVYFYLTEGCNCACRHCWLEPKFDPEAHLATLPVKTFEAVIREALPLGLKWVKLTGGEPLLHPRIIELLNIVLREELALSIETNGFLCTPELATAIARIPRRFISVSLDGVDPETLAWIRGVPDAFDKAMRGIACLVGAGVRPQIVMSIMRRNVGQVEAVIRLAERVGASSVKFNLIQPTTRGKQLHEADETLGIAELIALGQHVERELAPEAKLTLHFDYPPAFNPLSRLANNGLYTCGIKGVIGVLPTGKYALCGIGEAVPELIFGRAGTDALTDVWFRNEILTAVRSGLPKHLTGICGRCLFKGKCLGKCVAQNYYRRRDLFAPLWFCEMAEAEGLFPASRIGA
jgi:SynChlorMet cassette radical SAM/SPASM protein ScmF